MSLFSRVFNKPTQVSLVREGQTFFLRFLYDNRPATYADVLEKWQELGALDRFVGETGQSSVAIKLSAVDSLKAVMRELRNRYASQNKLNFYIWQMSKRRNWERSLQTALSCGIHAKVRD